MAGTNKKDKGLLQLIKNKYIHFNINPKILCNLITEDFNYSKGNINLFYRYRFKSCVYALSIARI